MRLNATERRMLIPLAVAVLLGLVVAACGLKIAAQKSDIDGLRGENEALRGEISKCRPGALERLGILLEGKARHSIDELEEKLNE